MLIFIPVLVICMNSQCEFQQAASYFVKESECRQVVDLQRTSLQSAFSQIKPRPRQPITVEGTCIVARIDLTAA